MAKTTERLVTKSFNVRNLGARRGHGRYRWPALLLALTLVVLVLPREAAAQTPRTGAIEVLNVTHDARGVLTLALRTDVDRAAHVQSMTVLVDDMPIALDVAERAIRKDLALVLVVDTSGSMAGVPINAALQASRELVTRLPSGDRVGVVSFASEPRMRSSLGANRAEVLAQIAALRADGATALFKAVQTGAEQFTAEGTRDRVIVLLSDGQDSGEPAGNARAESIRRAQESGAAVYAIGVGEDYDETYLRELAGATRGQFFAVRSAADTAALTGLLTQLGDRFAAAETYTIPITSLAPGPHRITVRGRINDAFATTHATFDVSYKGLFAPSVQYPLEPDGVVVVRLGGAASASALTVQARLDGQPLSLQSPADLVEIDPWQHLPGAHTLDLVALTPRGELVHREAVPLTLPRLEPVIRTIPSGDGLLVQGFVQGVKRPGLVARQGTNEVARGEGQIVLPRDARPASLDLMGSTGELVLTQEVEGVVAAQSPGQALFVIAAIAALVTGGWLLAKRGRARRPRRSIVERIGAEPLALLAERSEAIAERSVTRSTPPPELRASTYGTLTVLEPNGASRAVPLTNRPLTLGSASTCGLVLLGPEIRPEHLRISRFSGDEVQMHVLGYDDGVPYAERGEDEWLIVRSGEEVMLAGYRFHVEFDDLVEEHSVPDGSSVAVGGR